LSRLDASFIPHWADDILKLKGLGFEVKGLDLLIWSYFVSQFESMEIADHELKYYFTNVVDALIKSGYVEKGRQMLILEKQEKRDQRQRENGKSFKQSALADFDDKVVEYLSGDTNAQAPNVEQKSDHQSIERELLWKAYLALKAGTEEDRVALLKTLDDYYDHVGKMA
jgi:hypothetical protein